VQKPSLNSLHFDGSFKAFMPDWLRAQELYSGEKFFGI